MRAVLAPVLALLAAGPVAAQGAQWQFQSFDDGSYFTGAIGPSDDSGITFLCGEKSPQGLSPYQTGNMEPDITPRDSLRLFIGEGLLGRQDGMTEARQDVLIVAGDTGYRLPVVTWDELFWAWVVDLPATDPMFAAIGGQAQVELRSAAGTQRLTASGFAAAHDSLIAYCQSMFTIIGQPWSSSTAAAVAPPVSMRQEAEAGVRAGCGGPAQFGEQALLAGDIDGDGAEDAVVFWEGLTCSGGYPRPFCGASMCSVQIYLSSRRGRGGNPDELLAQAVRLQPLSNGNMGVATVMSLVSCQGRPGCEIIWYWNGTGMVQLP